MPKKILILLFSFLALAAQAQVHRAYTKPDRDWAYMFKGGWQLHSLTQGQFKSNPGHGWHVGVAFKAPIGGKWWIQPELLYSTRRSTLSYADQAEVTEASFTFNYIEIPLLLNYRASDIFEFLLGPQLSFLTQNSIKAEGNDPTAISFTPVDLQQIDFALAAGLEVNISPLAIGIRYTYSFPTIATTEQGRLWLGQARLQGIMLYGALVF